MFSILFMLTAESMYITEPIITGQATVHILPMPNFLRQKVSRPHLEKAIRSTVILASSVPTMSSSN